MHAGVCIRPIPPHVRSILLGKAAEPNGGMTATLQSCFRAGTGIKRTIGATGGLTK